MTTVGSSTVPPPLPEPGSFPEEALVLDTLYFEGPVGEPVDTSISAYRDGNEETAAATFVIDNVPSVDDLADPFDPDNAATISGTLEVTTPGWSVSGSFVAAYCPDLNTFAIGE